MMLRVVTVILLVGMLVVLSAKSEACAEPIAPSPTTVPVESVVASLSPTPGPTESVTPVLVGVASTYGPGFDGYLAVPLREWRGKTVEVCWRDRCVTGVVNDLGPDQRVHPDRVVDLDVAQFEELSGQSWRIGVLRDVTVRLIGG